MEPSTQETKIENLRVHAQAKGKLKKAQRIIQAKRGPYAEKPSLTETLLIVADHYIATAQPA